MISEFPRFWKKLMTANHAFPSSQRGGESFSFCSSCSACPSRVADHPMKSARSRQRLITPPSSHPPRRLVQRGSWMAWERSTFRSRQHQRIPRHSSIKESRSSTDSGSLKPSGRSARRLARISQRFWQKPNKLGLRGTRKGRPVWHSGFCEKSGTLKRRRPF